MPRRHAAGQAPQAPAGRVREWVEGQVAAHVRPHDRLSGPAGPGVRPRAAADRLPAPGLRPRPCVTFRPCTNAGTVKRGPNTQEGLWGAVRAPQSLPPSRPVRRVRRGPPP
ncbi:hypothetical protein GCM10010343_29230 [Streptomyces avidinii]|nr:hypothetical protein GCM10010343_29230 [Streptomyces avidinii]